MPAVYSRSQGLAPPQFCTAETCRWAGRTFAAACPLCGESFYPSALNYNFRETFMCDSDTLPETESEVRDGVELTPSEREALDPHPPSEKLVYYELAGQGSLSVPEIAERTTLNRRTAQRAARELHDAGLLDARPDASDPSRTVFVVNFPPEGV